MVFITTTSSSRTLTLLFVLMTIIIITSSKISISSSFSSALRFDMIPSQQYCFHQEAQADISTVHVDFDTFNMISERDASSMSNNANINNNQNDNDENPHAYRGFNVGSLSMIVFDPTGNTAVKNRDLSQFIGRGGDDSSRTEFETSMAGEWEICLTWSAQSKLPQNRGVIHRMPRLDLDITSNVNLNYRNPSISPDDYSALSSMLTPLFEEAMTEMDYLTARALNFEKTVSSTYVRVATFTILEVVIASAVVGWQVWTLRRFFKTKKVV